MLKALANKRRLAIIQVLRKRRKENVGEIARAINLSFKATSKHLNVLAAVDIVDKEQRSLQMWYSLAPTLPEAAKRIIHLL